MAKNLRAFTALLLAALVFFAPAVALADETWAAYSVPEASVPAAILMDSQTGKVLMEKNADEQREPASTTKVMTALVVLERANLDDVVTVEESDLAELSWDSSTAGLQAGETYSVRDLLACLLVPSGNDAAYVLARYVGGDWQSFVDLMNQKAAELGCEGTNFVNPCGLHAEGHVTTARDLATIFLAALDQPVFVEIAGSQTWDLEATSLQSARTLENTDQLIDSASPVYMGDAVVAAKTGYTSEAGRCLVAAATDGARTVVGVVLGGENSYDSAGVTPNYYDMKTLLEWGLSAWQNTTVVAAGDAVGSVEVLLSSTGDEVSVLSGAAISGTFPAEMTSDDVTFELVPTSSETLRAPVEEGTVVGEAQVYVDGQQVGSVSANTASTMELSIPKYILDWLQDPLHLIIAVAVLVAVLVLVGLLGSRRSRRVERRRGQSGRYAGLEQLSSANPVRPSNRARGAGRRSKGGSHMRGTRR